MSAPRTPASRPDVPPTQVSVAIGPRVLEILDLAYRARRPLLLEGPTGIGKSQIVSQFAEAAGLKAVVLDLSLLEPPDLIGLPVIHEGRTRYAAPSELPTSGNGILLLEELNRAEIPVMQPALQLLSARRLHAYELPPGWMCVAAINPEDGDYQVNRLDPALRSRFLQLSVRADREMWLAWAVRANIHPVISRVVRDHEDAFETASPRSWAYASELLHSLRAADLGNTELIRVALRGYLPGPWAQIVTAAMVAAEPAPEIDLDIILGPEGEAALAGIVRDLESRKRVDAVAMVAARLRRLLGRKEFAARIELPDLERVLAVLPGDLRDQCLQSAVESPAAPELLRRLGYDIGTLLAGYETSPLRTEIGAWRREMKLHRVRLVVAAVARSLDGKEVDLTALIEDVGPLAAPLRARSPS